MAVASAPLSPKELAKPSTRVAAVKALMASSPREFTAPCTSSFPMYKLHICRAVTALKRAVRRSRGRSSTMSSRPNISWGKRSRR